MPGPSICYQVVKNERSELEIFEFFIGNSSITDELLSVRIFKSLFWDSYKTFVRKKLFELFKKIKKSCDLYCFTSYLRTISLTHFYFSPLRNCWWWEKIIIFLWYFRDFSNFYVQILKFFIQFSKNCWQLLKDVYIILNQKHFDKRLTFSLHKDLPKQ